VSHHFQASTLTELHDKLCMSLVTAAKDELDVISSVDVQMHNVLAECDSMEWDFDMKDMWLTPSRWTMMINQYLDPEELEAWVNQITSKIGLKKRGICTMRTKKVAARGGEATGHTNKETRRWGSCMLAISYKAMPTPTIAMHSRTSYLGYIGALDLTVAWMCAKVLAEAMGVDVSTFRFVWHNEAIQWHNFKSLAFLLNHPDKKIRKKYRRLLMKKDKKLTEAELAEIENSPGLRLSKKWLAKVIQEDKDGLTYGDMTYNTYRRIRRRYHTEVHGFDYAEKFEGWSYYKQGEKKGEEKEFFKAYKPLPSTHVDTLSFDKLVPPEKLAGAEFTGEGMEDEDDE
jgi:hypothetical protein